MTSPSAPADTRAQLAALLRGIVAGDERERRDLDAVARWVDSGAPLYRTRSPDVPATHLVSYLVVQDPDSGRLLLLWHRKAGLLLPAGGHVEPGEDPWQTVCRESREELRLDAVASPQAGPRPLFVTVTSTRGPGSHTDVSLWYLLHAPPHAVTWFDEREFAGCEWLTPDEALTRPLVILDPHMHRFIRKVWPGTTGRPDVPTPHVDRPPDCAGRSWLTG